MIDHVKQSIVNQFEAALRMLNDCVEMCPDAHWNAKVAKYPFWQVAYHTLCFVDYYLSPGEAAFQTRPEIHPTGFRELADEYPSRQFDREEIRAYLNLCREKVRTALAADTESTLSAVCGFGKRTYSRLELHIYNTRHIQHHTGQLSAFLRRVDPSLDPEWFGSGWPSTPLL